MRYLLFIDYDDTLHDTRSKYAAKFEGIYGLPAETVMSAYMAVHRGIVHRDYPEKHDDFYFHQRLIASHLHIPYDEIEARKMADRFREAREECWTDPVYFPDTMMFLDKASQTHTLCLTTGDYAQEKARALEKTAGFNYFTYFFDHTILGMKGSRGYFRNALTITKSSPDQVTVIGDSMEHDIECGHEAGLTTIWINRRGLKPVYNSITPNYVVTTLLEALRHINGT